MNRTGWSTFSFTDVIKPEEGWKTEHALLATYSADLVVIVRALLALAGFDLDFRRTGNRIELVKAIESLGGRVRVLAQAGRVTAPGIPRPVLKLLDRFLLTVDENELQRSWHPKVVLVRYQRVDDPSDRMWRVWVGSRNLTQALNWDAGLVLASRSDRRGVNVQGLDALGAELARRARLPSLPPAVAAQELGALTWEGPPGTEVLAMRLFGPAGVSGYPLPSPDTERVFLISPFLDKRTVRTIATWGGAQARRSLVSTSLELQRLYHADLNVFKGFNDVLIQPLPDLPGEGADSAEEAAPPPSAEAEDEDNEPAGLHAKLLFAGNRLERNLWLGSANATERGWLGQNHEVVSHLRIKQDVAEELEEFIAKCEQFRPNAVPPAVDEAEEILEAARKSLASGWPLRQSIRTNNVEVTAAEPPPLGNPAIRLQAASLGGAWTDWPHESSSVALPGLDPAQRSDFLQMRLSCGPRMCSWIALAPCSQPPDVDRDRAIIAQYLDTRMFLQWLRSLLAAEAPGDGGGDWDDDDSKTGPNYSNTTSSVFTSVLPTIEEVLGAWARDQSAFRLADEKVKAYLPELHRRATSTDSHNDVDLLETLQRMWDTLASELR